MRALKDDPQLLVCVCHFLFIEELFSLLLVCKQWKLMFSSLSSGWSNLSLASHKCCNSLIKKYSQWEKRDQIQSLSFEFCNRLTDEVLMKYLPFFVNVNALNLNGCPLLTDEMMKIVAKCNLYRLDLFWNPGLTHQSIAYLMAGSFCGNITHLNLSGVKYLTDESIMLVASSCPSVIHLDLTRLERISNASLAALAEHCKKLRVLLLYACNNFTDEGILAIARGCLHLESFDMTGSQKVTDAAITELALRCPKLSWLNMVWCLHLTDKCLFGLGKYAHELTFLSIHGNQLITVAGLAALNQCTKLETLDVNGCKLVSDRSFSAMKILIPSLQRLLAL